MNCKNCGKETENEAELCPECANAAEETVETPTPEVEKETSEVVFDEIKSTLNPTSAMDNVKNAMSDNVEESEDSPKYCFKKSLTGTILAGVAMIVLIIVSIFNGVNAALRLENSGSGVLAIVGSVFCMLFALAAVGISIPALVTGIKCVIRTAKRLNKPVKPIAPFVLSCVAALLGLSCIGWGLGAFVNSIMVMVAAI